MSHHPHPTSRPPHQDVYAFKQAFDGHLFVGAKGNQYRATVEYAPFQKTPSPSAKKDARDGTIIKGGR